MHAASPVPYPDADWEPGSALYTATAVPPGQLFTNKGPPGATVTLPTWLAGVTWISGATEDSDSCHVPPLALMVASAYRGPTAWPPGPEFRWYSTTAAVAEVKTTLSTFTTAAPA